MFFPNNTTCPVYMLQTVKTFDEKQFLAAPFNRLDHHLLCWVISEKKVITNVKFYSQRLILPTQKKSKKKTKQNKKNPKNNKQQQRQL